MKISELVLHTDDLEGSREFYHKIPGISLIRSNSENLNFAAGSTRLTFTRSDGTKPVYHFAFNIFPEKLPALLAVLKNQVEFIEYAGSPIVDFPDWQAQSVYFYDNNGNIVEMIGRKAMELSDGTRKEEVILSVSEIGIPVENVRDACAAIQRKTSIPYFVKQPPADKFAAMGNDEGLLIFSEVGRKWFPTEISATKHPVEFSLESENNSFTLRYNS